MAGHAFTSSAAVHVAGSMDVAGYSIVSPHAGESLDPPQPVGMPFVVACRLKFLRRRARADVVASVPV